MKETAYDILKLRLCTVRNAHTAWRQVEPISNRAQALIDFLIDQRIAYQVDLFGPKKSPNLCNVIVKFDDAELEERVIFTAHHDVVNLRSDNVLDNGASCANLLALAQELSGSRLKRRAAVVFTDCEEFGGLGAKRLTESVLAGDFGQVVGIVNSELTGKGEIWTDRLETGFIGDKLRAIDAAMPQHPTPFNDSWIFRRAGLATVCLGIMPAGEMETLQRRHTCDYWRYCHQSDDGLHNADEESMQRYVQQLKQFTE